jgi:hypothetical protein
MPDISGMTQQEYTKTNENSRLVRLKEKWFSSRLDAPISGALKPSFPPAPSFPQELRTTALKRLLDFLSLRSVPARWQGLLVAGPSLALLSFGALYLFLAAAVCDPLYTPPVSEIDGAEGARAALDRARAGEDLPATDIAPWPHLSFGPYCRNGAPR